ncbi:hypothetical protein K4L06_10045 [Lysobacter sp. BMK333-48F3]|uniref:hypothetical protein n=1 Tax=Lysobacter sp. BMK333-48F3 TaxID=2867962 RepID=UPI001C8B19EC|nr:hypothetical protein [Lysobacter sp. BMK333-48F3]MBX9401655.1 hypothetical protein [Lysobacter sp. BMK333-48F3]
MMKLDSGRSVGDYFVHGDDANDHTFYILPQGPTFARMSNGDLALRFVEYGQIREDGGKKFGGFIAFDTDLSIPADDKKKIVAELQKELAEKYKGKTPPKVVIAPVLWTDGTVELLLTEGGALVEKIRGAGKPSLYGDNKASFMVELTELGTAIFKETLSTGSASAVQVVYKLNCYMRLPEMKAWGTWNASEFYRFAQEVTVKENCWGDDAYSEMVSSTRWKNDVTKTHFDFVQAPNGTPEENAKLEADIRAAINKQLEAAVQRNLLKEIAEVDPNIKELQEGQDFEKIRRAVSKTQIANVRIEWSEAKAVIVNRIPQGMLPTITSLKDGKNKPLKWENYYSKINLDEFLKTVRVNMRVNADFANLPIHSVEVKINYPHGPNKKVQEFTFTSPDDVAKFEAFVHQGIRKFKYSYTVNYKGNAFKHQSPEIETDDTNLVINVDDLGLLTLDIGPGDIDFAQVPRTQVTVRYKGGKQPVEAKFNLTKDTPTFQLRKIIGVPRTQDIEYDLLYSLADGRQIRKSGAQQAKELYIDDPFTAQKTISFRAAGDLENEIASITVEGSYEDTANKYSQKTVITLSKDMTSFDWAFPVVEETLGTVKYAVTTLYADGTSKEEPEQVATRSTVLVGKKLDALEVAVVPDLLNWDDLKMVSVALSHGPKRIDLRFKAGDEEKSWKLPIANGEDPEYDAKITYFMADNSRKVVALDDATDLTLFLEVPA